jgi:hypothetical protein
MEMDVKLETCSCNYDLKCNDFPDLSQSVGTNKTDHHSFLQTYTGLTGGACAIGEQPIKVCMCSMTFDMGDQLMTMTFSW